MYGNVTNSSHNFVDPFGLDKKRCAGPRNDYYSAQASIGPGGGVQFQLTLDRYGRLYFAAGGQIGKSLWLIGPSIFRGGILSKDTPSEERLAHFMRGGDAFHGAAVAIVGPNFVWTGK